MNILKKTVLSTLSILGFTASLQVQAGPCTTGTLSSGNAADSCEANGLTWSLMTVTQGSNDEALQFSTIGDYLNCTIGDITNTACAGISGIRLPNMRELSRQFQYGDLTQETALKYAEPKEWIKNASVLVGLEYQQIDMSKHDPYLITSTIVDLDRNRADGKYQIKAFRLKTGQLVNLSQDLNFCHNFTSERQCAEPNSDDDVDQKNYRDTSKKPLIVLAVSTESLFTISSTGALKMLNA